MIDTKLRRILREVGDRVEPAAPDWSTVSDRGVVRRSPQRLPARVAVVLAALIAAGAMYMSIRGSDETQIPAGSAALPDVLPGPSSDVSPEFLQDGTPVWVVRHEDGTLSVLGALTRQPWGVGVLAEWCGSSRGFEDTHGVRWDEYGRRRAGPGGAAIAYESRPVGHSVEVVRELGRLPLSDNAAAPTGPACEGPPPYFNLVHTAWHDVSELKRFSGDGGNIGYVRFDGDLVIRPTGAQICLPSADTCSAGPRVDGVNLAVLRDEAQVVVRGPLIGRVVNGRATSVIASRPHS